MKLSKEKLIILIPVVITILVLVVISIVVHAKNTPASLTLSPTPLLLQQQQQAMVKNSPTLIPGFAIVSLEKTKSGANVMIDTNNKNISGVQVEISYDPQVLTNVQITNGSFFPKSIILTNKVTNGTIFYAIAIPPQSNLQKGKGILATISYTLNQGIKSPTSLQFLSRTKVTVPGIEQSMIKRTQDLTFPVQ